MGRLLPVVEGTLIDLLEELKSQGLVKLQKKGMNLMKAGGQAVLQQMLNVMTTMPAELNSGEMQMAEIGGLANQMPD